jgi:hypothetical protein|tara:strand:- start:117 stop:584 length:468 start_codon:yes stop_codon:yes gene_type:complete
MDTIQQERKFSREHKDKYISTKDIYKNIKKELRVNTKWSRRKKEYRTKELDYSTFYSIVKRFLEILIRDLTERFELIHLPENLGYLYIDKKEHKRPFHIRVDIKESDKLGKIIKYKVPILDDYYYKLVWKRPRKFARCKIMPLAKFKKSINKLKK